MCVCRSPRRSSRLDEHRQRARARPCELDRALADLGRHRLVAEVAVDLVLVVGLEDLAALDGLDAPLRDLQTALDRVLAHRDVVGLRAGEVLQEVAEGGGRDDAQVDLHAVVRDDRALRIAAADDLRRDRLLAEPADQRGRLVGGGDQVDVADHLHAAAQRPGLATRARRSAVPADPRGSSPTGAARARGGSATSWRPRRRRSPRGSPAPSSRRCRRARAGCPRPLPPRAARASRCPARRRCAWRSWRRRPGSRLISTRLSGSFARSFSSETSVPVSRSSRTLAAIVSPTPSSWVRRPSSDRRQTDSGVSRMLAAALR